MADVNVDIIKIDTSQASQSMGNLKKEMKEVREQMIELRLRGEETSEAYQKLAGRAGELSRAMKLASNDINEASTTFSNTVQYVSGSLAGVSGAVQAATGALALMGVQMDNDSKLMKTLVAAMSITSGLQAIQGSVEAFKKLAVNIQRSTIAQRGFNAAMKANPVGFIIGGITALGAALVGYIHSLNEASAAQEELNQKIKDQTAAMREAAREMGENNATEFMKQLNKQRRLWKAQGQEQINIERQTRAEIEKEIKRQTAARQAAIEEQARIQKQVEALGGWSKVPRDAEGGSYYNTLMDKQQAIMDSANAEIAALQQEITLVNEEIKILQLEAATEARREAQRKKTSESADDIAERELSAIQKTKDGFLSAQAAEEKALTDRYKKDYELFVKYNEDTKGLTAKYLADMAQIQEKYRKEAEQKRQTEAQGRVDEMELELLKEYYQKRKEIVESNEKDIDDKLNELELVEIQNEITLLNERYNNGLIATQEYETQLLQLETEMAEKRIEIKEREKEKKEKIERGYLQSIQSITGSIGGILGSIGDMMEDETETQKNLKAAQAIINTIAGAVAAFMGITESTGGWGIAAAIAQAAAVTAAGMAQVAQIYAVDTKGGKNSTSNTGISAGSVSTLTQNYSNTRLVANGGGVYDLSGLEEQQQNTRVYVLTSDIQTGLNRVNVTTAHNTF